MKTATRIPERNNLYDDTGYKIIGLFGLCLETTTWVSGECCGGQMFMRLNPFGCEDEGYGCDDVGLQLGSTAEYGVGYGPA